MPKFRAICVVTMVAAAIAFSNLGAQAKGQPQDLALHQINDPGDPPPFDPADYDQYRRGDGTAQISGNIALNEPPFHDFVCNDPQLYPNTPYVRWLINKWAWEADGKPILRERLVNPGESGMHLSVPAYLMPYGSDPHPATFDGRCRNYRDHTFVWFDHIPAGRYIFIELLQRGVAYTGTKSTSAVVYGPYGAAPGFISQDYGGTHPADGFEVGSYGDLVVKAGHSYTINPKNIIPIAYVL